MNTVIGKYLEIIPSSVTCNASEKTVTAQREAPDKYIGNVFKLMGTRTDVGRETPDQSLFSMIKR